MVVIYTRKVPRNTDASKSMSAYKKSAAINVKYGGKDEGSQ